MAPESIALNTLRNAVKKKSDNYFLKLNFHEIFTKFTNLITYNQTKVGRKKVARSREVNSREML